MALANVIKVLGLALLLAAAPGSLADVPDEGLVRGGKVPSMFLLYTGDVIGYLETCGCKTNPAGGLARRAWVVDEIRSKFPATPILILDSGNFSDNPTPQGDAKTTALVDAMGRIGYAAANVGERDVRLGWEHFTERTRAASFPFVSANIVRKDNGEPVFAPRAMVEAVSADGQSRQKVGIVGVARFNPSFLKAGPGDSNITIAHPLEPTRREVAALQAEGADIIVLLAAMNQDDARRIVGEVPGIDFVVGSYGGALTPNAEKDGETWIAYAGNQGKYLAETRLFLGAEKEVQHQITIMHFLTQLYPSNAAMQSFVEQVPLEGTGSGSRVAPAGDGAFLGSGACRKCHIDAFDQWNQTAHAQAFATLTKGSRDGDASCRSCHVTGAAAVGGFNSAEATPHLAHVGCESCHGPGRAHVENNLVAYGKVTIETCTGCHDLANSPEFDYYTYLPRVAHGTRAAR